MVLMLSLVAGFHFFTNGEESTISEPEQAEVEQVDISDSRDDSGNMETETEGAIDLDEEFVQLNTNNEDGEEEQDVPNYGLIPQTVEIPSIDVNAEIENVGILDNGQMGVPSNEDDVAWFEPGTMPGDKGNAVLAGHVDSYTGPAVFWDLGELEEGDEIIITDEAGETLVFQVRKSVSYGRNDAPIDEIFGETDEHRLNLITCSGTFNRDEGTHDERLVVYTELVDPDPSQEETVEEEDLPTTPDNVEVLNSRVAWHAVQDEDVVGYRIYRKDQDSGEFEHVGSVSAHERKSYSDNDAASHVFYITSVDVDGNESEPSEETSFE